MSGNIVVQHAHCVICGKAMSYDEDDKTCSEECKAKLGEQSKKRRKFFLMMLAFAALAMLLSVWGSIPRG